METDDKIFKKGNYSKIKIDLKFLKWTNQVIPYKPVNLVGETGK